MDMRAAEQIFAVIGFVVVCGGMGMIAGRILWLLFHGL